MREFEGSGFRADTRPPIPRGPVFSDYKRGETCGRCGRSWGLTVVHAPGDSEGLELASWRSFCATYPHADDHARAM